MYLNLFIFLNRRIKNLNHFVIVSCLSSSLSKQEKKFNHFQVCAVPLVFGWSEALRAGIRLQKPQTKYRRLLYWCARIGSQHQAPLCEYPSWKLLKARECICTSALLHDILLSHEDGGQMVAKLKMILTASHLTMSRFSTKSKWDEAWYLQSSLYDFGGVSTIALCMDGMKFVDIACPLGDAKIDLRIQQYSWQWKGINIMAQ